MPQADWLAALNIEVTADLMLQRALEASRNVVGVPAASLSLSAAALMPAFAFVASTHCCLGLHDRRVDQILLLMSRVLGKERMPEA